MNKEDRKMISKKRSLWYKIKPRRTGRNAILLFEIGYIIQIFDAITNMILEPFGYDVSWDTEYHIYLLVRKHKKARW